MMLGSGASLGRHRVFMSKHGFCSAHFHDGEMLIHDMSFSLVHSISFSSCKIRSQNNR